MRFRATAKHQDIWTGLLYTDQKGTDEFARALVCLVDDLAYRLSLAGRNFRKIPEKYEKIGDAWMRGEEAVKIGFFYFFVRVDELDDIICNYSHQIE